MLVDQIEVPVTQGRFSSCVPIEVGMAITDPRIRSYKYTDYDKLSLWMNDLGRFYDGHDDENRLIDQLVGAEKIDSMGFFTKCKFMLVYEVNNEPAGMLCLNYKRGGSAKIGPVIVNPEIRGQGVGSSLLKSAEEAARAGGVRKLYATTSHLNTHVNHLIEKADFKIEACFPNQYKRGSEEYIWGKHLICPGETDINQVRSILTDAQTVGEINLSQLTGGSTEYISQMNEIYQQWHDDLGSDFIQGMIAGTERCFSFQQKGKVIFVAKDSEGEKGMLTFTPKRGGPVKLYPIYGTPEAQIALLNKAKEIAADCGNHKLYTFVHEFDRTQIEFLKSLGFVTRGLLESPYKVNHNLMPLDLSLYSEA